MPQQSVPTSVPAALAGVLSVAMAAALLVVAPRPAEAVATLQSARALTYAAPDAALLAVAALLAWALLTWLAAGIVLVGAGRLPGVTGRYADAVAGQLLPAGLRRALGVALGASLALGAAAVPASASAPTSAPTSVRTPNAGDAGLDWPAPAAPSPAPTPAPRPARPADAAVPTPVQPDPVTFQRVGASVIVRPGDSLWALADRALCVAAEQAPSNAAIAAAWPTWWAANREAVGDDPDLLYPGTTLFAPPRSP